MVTLKAWGTTLMFVTIAVAQEEYGLFDLGLDSPLNSIWTANHRFPVALEGRSSCVVSGTQGGQDGTCMNAAACRFQRGKPTGRGRSCSFWNTCCVFEKTANQTTDSRITYFVSTKGARSLPQAQKMYVRLANKNVCQMRVDIINMNILPPSAALGGITAICDRDYLRVDPQSIGYKIPLICGKNTNQHFYIHLSMNQIINNGVILSVKLLEDINLPEPIWNIKVTQLECPGNRNLINLQHHKDIRSQVVSDFSQLAPPNCLQYFTDTRGEISNFGYESSKSCNMATDQDYAICFKSNDGYCGVNLKADVLNLRSTGPECNEESIYIPEHTAKICGLQAPPTVEYISEHPGSLYIHVSSHSSVNAMMEVDPLPYGFHFTYTSIRCNDQ